MSKASATPDATVTGQTNGARRATLRVPVPPCPDTDAGDPTVAVPAAPEQLIRPLALRAMFMRPAYLAQSAWLEHVPFAFWLVEAHRPGVIVELGTHHGVSYFALCQAVERLGLATRCYAVDSWKGDAHAGFYGEEVFEQVRAHNDAHYSGFSRLVRSSFDAALDHFSDGTIELLHIDGLHTIEAMRHDFESWLPKLSERAVVMLHDSNVRERDFGVFRLVEELREQYPCFEFVHGHGLAVLGIGAEQSAYLERLFAVSGHEGGRRAVQEMFARLGRATADAHAAQEGASTERALEATVSRHKTKVESLSRTLERTNRALEKRDAKVKKARARLERQAEQHAAERGRLAERATLLLELRNESRQEAARLAARADQATAEMKERADARIALEATVHEQQRLLGEAQAETTRERDTARDARAELERKRETLTATQGELEARQQALDAAQAALEQARAEQKAAEQATTSTEAQLEMLRGELEQLRTQHTATLSGLAAEQEAAASARAERDELSKERDWEREARTAAETRLAADREAAAETQVDLQAELDEARSELERERRALGATRRELEAARYECSRAEETQRAARERLECERRASVAVRSELESTRMEVARQGELAEKAQFGLEAERGSRTKAEQALQKERTAAADAAMRHREELAEQESWLCSAESDRDRFRAEAESARRGLDERVSELARLTRLLQETEARVEQRDRQLDESRKETEARIEQRDRQLDESRRARQAVARLLGQTIIALGSYTPERPPRPGKLRRLGGRLKEAGVLDPDWYLACNRDVSEAALDPVRHYLLEGVREGREPRDVAPLLGGPGRTEDT